jgi:parallel beta-helix repeat protein
VLISVLTMLILLGNVSGRTIYVDDDGGADFREIQDAIDSSLDGDTVIVMDGSYEESVQVNKAIHLIGSGPDTKVYTYSGDAMVLKANGINLSNMHVQSYSFGNDHVVVTSDHTTIFNMYYPAFSSASSIELSGADHTTIRDILFETSGSGYTIQNKGSHFSTITNCTFNGTYLSVEIRDSSCVMVSDCEFNDNQYGFSISNSWDCIVRDCVLDGSERGFSVSGSTNITLQDNMISNRENRNQGISFYRTGSTILKRNTLQDCTITMTADTPEQWTAHDIDSSNTINGKQILYYVNRSNLTIESVNAGLILIANCTDLLVKDVTMGDGIYGIFGAYITRGTFDNFHVDNYSNGLRITDSQDLTFRDCSLNNSSYGYQIYRCENVQLSECDVTGMGTGISLWETYNGSMTDSRFRDCEYAAVRLSEAVNCTLMDLVLESGGEEAIEIVESENCSVIRCSIGSFAENGMHLDGSKYITLTDTEFEGSGIYIAGDRSENWTTHTIDTTNLVNNRPIYYYHDMDSITVPSDAGQVILAVCEDFTLRDLELHNTSGAIQFYKTYNSTIEGCAMNGNQLFGIRFSESPHNSVVNSSVTNSSGTGLLIESPWIDVTDSFISHASESGILLDEDSHNVSITGTDILFSEMQGILIFGYDHIIDDSRILNSTGDGIYVNEGCGRITIRDCLIRGNDEGVEFYKFNDLNEISGCTITNNARNGISFGESCVQNQVSSCTISRNVMTAVRFYLYSYNATVTDCIMEGNRDGVYFYHADGSLIRNSTFTDSSQFGIQSQSTNDILIEKCTAIRSTYRGFYLSTGINCTIIDCEIDGAAEEGIGAYNIDEMIITNVRVVNGPEEGLKLYRCDSVSLDQLFISDCFDGVHLDETDGITCMNSTIQSCERYGIIGEALSNIVFTSNNICYNEKFGVYILGGGEDLDATTNFWGDYSGPYHSNDHPEGKGDRVSDFVDYTPWLSVAFDNDHWPVAYIVSISTDSCREGDSINMQGMGIPFDDEDIVRYSWASSLDGEFYNDSSDDIDVSLHSNGTHIISLKVMDENGSWSRPVQTEVFVKKIPTAVIEQVSPILAREGEPILFSGLGDSDCSIDRYIWRSSWDGEFYNGSNPSCSYSGLSLGSHTISLTVLDSAGLWSEIAVIDIYVNGVPHASIEEIDPDTVNEGEPIHFTGGGMDDGEVRGYIWASSIDGELYNGTSDNFVTSLSGGTHTITLRVVDDLGSLSKPESTTLSINARPHASIDAISPSPALFSDVINFQGSAEDDGTILRYQWNSSLAGALYNGTEPIFSTSLSAHFGFHTITLRVMDDAGFWSEPVSTELLVYSRPVVESVHHSFPDPYTPDEPVAFQIHATDKVEIVNYKVTSSIDGLVYNGSIMVEIMGMSSGDHEITVVVTNIHGIRSQPWAGFITIPGVNHPPSISITSPQEGTVQKGTFILRGTADDEEQIDITIEISLDNGDWISFSGGEQWERTFTDEDLKDLEDGNHTISVRASDGFLYSDVITYNFTLETGGDAKKSGGGGFIPAFQVMALIVSFGCVVILRRGRRK